MVSNQKLTIGFIIYSDKAEKYLSHFLPSLFSQNNKDFSVIAIDNSENKENKAARFLKEKYPQIKLNQIGENMGFAKAFNIMINQAMKNGSEFFLALNPDIIIERDAIKMMLRKIEDNSELGSVSPRILKWDFENKVKTNQIDSCGIIIKPGLQFIDLGQAEEDRGQYNNKSILGPSGAVALYRMSALEKITSPQPPPIRRAGSSSQGEGEKREFFDELMFMYKEDCDLAYRLSLAGYKSVCVGEAIVYHDRTVFGKGEGNLKIALNRKNKSPQAKKWSFLNQQIIFFKYWKIQDWKNKLAIIWQETRMFFFILIFEQYLLGQFLEFFKIRKKIKRY